jgi:hypothetical protein
MSTQKSGSCQTENCPEVGIVYLMDTENIVEVLICGTCQNQIPLIAVND